MNPLTEELEDPGRDVARIYVSGMATVVVISLVFNIAFFSVLKADDLTSFLAAPFARAVAGEWLSSIIAFMVAMCCLGSSNGMLMGIQPSIGAATVSII